MGFFLQFGFCCFRNKTVLTQDFRGLSVIIIMTKSSRVFFLSQKGKVPGVRKHIKRARKVKQQDEEGWEEKVLQSIKVQMTERKKIAQSLVW